MVILLTPLSLFVAGFISKKTHKYFARQSERRGKLTGYIDEMIGNEKVVQAFSYEDKAKERIFSLLPEDQKADLIALFDEFEAYETPESKYAHAMDNLQPLILNNSNGGSDWKEHGVTSSQVYGRQSKTKLGSEKLYQEVVDKIIQEQIKKGNIKE
jgi:ABC-type multidrug transport system fused ATPase/permease subunit